MADINQPSEFKEPLAEIEQVAIKIKEMITQMNTNTTGIASINTALDAIPDPVTITLETLTLDAVNAAFVTQLDQMKTLIDGIQA